jgi:hypothetical protein
VPGNILYLIPPIVGHSKDRELTTRLERLVKSLGIDLSHDEVLSDSIYLQTLQQIEDYQLKMQGSPIETMEVEVDEEQENGTNEKHSQV